MKKATKIAFIFVSILSSYSFAQQQAQFTQFNDNMLYFNPAYAGTRGMMNITGVHRQQWVGFSGAPVSQTISVNTPLKKHENGAKMNEYILYAGAIGALCNAVLQFVWFYKWSKK